MPLYRLRTLLLILLILPSIGMCQVLMIGNSYTESTGPRLQQLFENAPLSCRQSVTILSQGGGTLKTHYENSNTLSTIRQGHWKVVIVQEQSERASSMWVAYLKNKKSNESFSDFTYSWPTPEKDYWNAANLLMDYIKRYNDAQIVIFNTWARHPNHYTEIGSESILATLGPGSNQERANRMQEYNTNSNEQFAANHPGSIVAPIAEAWRLSFETHPSIRLHDTDNSHASAEGNYISASILYGMITGAPVSQNPYRGGLNTATSETIGQVADSFRESLIPDVSLSPRTDEDDLNIQWTCVPCTRYTIESSEDLETWTPSENIESNPDQTQIETRLAAPQKTVFHRVAESN